MSATDDFQKSLGTVHALIQLEAALRDPPRVEERAASDGLRGAVVVLTLACFEGFLQTLFEEQLDRIDSAGVPLESYGPSLHASAVFESLDFAHRGEVGDNRERKERLPSSVAIARTIGSGGFAPRALSSTKSNPNAATIARMFKAVGRGDAWRCIQSTFEDSWGAQVAQTYCRDKLDELVRSRNQVAHTAVSSHITRSYLGETVEFISKLGEAIHAELESHVGSSIEAARKRQEADDDDWAAS